MSVSKPKTSSEDWIGVGFSHKKMYLASAWRNAEKYMKALTDLGYVKPYDFGRGKGKWTTTEKGENISFSDLGKLAVDEMKKQSIKFK